MVKRTGKERFLDEAEKLGADMTVSSVGVCYRTKREPLNYLPVFAIVM
jgi:hypothetical protein